MTNERKHSPLPWKVTKGQKSDELFVTEGRGHGRICRIWNGRSGRDENAAFIVRACNNHYKLVEALRTLISDHDQRVGIGRKVDVAECECFDEAKQALTEAEAA